MQSQISYNLVKTGWDIGIKNKILMHEHWNGVCKKQSTGGQTLPTQLICCKTILFNTRYVVFKLSIICCALFHNRFVFNCEHRCLIKTRKRLDTLFSKLQKVIE